MGQAHENQKQGQLAQSGVAESGGEAQNIGDLFQCVQQAKNGAEGGFGQRRMIELPAEGATEGFDARRIPAGKIDQGAIFDFAVFAVRPDEGEWREETCDSGWWHPKPTVPKTA